MLQLYYISLNARRENKKKQTFRDIEKTNTKNETAAEPGENWSLEQT